MRRDEGASGRLHGEARTEMKENIRTHANEFESEGKEEVYTFVLDTSN